MHLARSALSRDDVHVVAANMYGEEQPPPIATMLFNGEKHGSPARLVYRVGFLYHTALLEIHPSAIRFDGPMAWHAVL